MDMWLSALTGLLYLLTTLHGLPLNADSDVIETNENGIVYVFNMYAVKNVKSDTVGKILSQQKYEKMPGMFESIGSIVLADDDVEPITLNELAELLEEFGVEVDKIDDENDPKVIEVKFEYDFSEADYIITVEEIVRYLQAEGIIINISQEDNVRIFQVEFDESIKDPADQPFKLEELVDFFNDQGFEIEVITSDDKKVKGIKIKMELSEEDDEDTESLPNSHKQNDEKVIEKKNEGRQNDLSIPNANEVKIEHKNKHEEENIIPLDFVTKSDSFNRIRRRRFACPECKTGNLIKQFINNYSEVH
ncbi:hypothetical protein PV327_007900 [Microctonus hyperodae]|uniref:Uncharacterized protein n=1 Tax=Microctonus hyperodae TaxID=165561 RepID=A0AA39G0X3_MICHY|nr:hypothetical protein PV327_007900 [Microctonus hyperodae]